MVYIGLVMHVQGVHRKLCAVVVCSGVFPDNSPGSAPLHVYATLFQMWLEDFGEMLGEHVNVIYCDLAVLTMCSLGLVMGTLLAEIDCQWLTENM